MERVSKSLNRRDGWFVRINREKLALLRRYDFKCGYCGADFADTDLSIDHLMPLCRGGSDVIENLIPSCISCNCSKRDKTLEEYRTYMAHQSTDYPRFSTQQIEFLKRHGIVLPLISVYNFFFEKDKVGG